MNNQQWQPIETAPQQDETVILIYDGFEVQSGYWATRKSWNGKPEGWTHHVNTDDGYNSYDTILGATHWMPLPAAPEVTV